MKELLATLDKVTPLPEAVDYVPEQAELMALPIAEELKNNAYFAQEEQSVMLDAFSMLKGLTMIKYEGSSSNVLNIELAGENYSRIKLFFLPHMQQDPEAELIREEYAPAAYYEIAEVDANWYIGVHKPDKA